MSSRTANFGKRCFWATPCKKRGLEDRRGRAWRCEWMLSPFRHEFNWKSRFPVRLPPPPSPPPPPPPSQMLFVVSE
eukprot:6213405-Pleurochrysis_carterae.AAC.1